MSVKCPACQEFVEQSHLCSKCGRSLDNLHKLVPWHRNPRDRNAAILWARSIMARRDWLILDSETTGINDTDEVIELGVIDCDGNIIMEQRINPVKRRISPKAQEIGHITLKDLKGKPNMLQAWQEFAPKINGRMIIAYNTAFDIRMLVQSLAKHNFPINTDKSLRFKTEDAMLKYAQYVGEWAEWKQEYKWQKLPHPAGSEQDAHTAIGDCKATLALIKRMADTPLEDETPEVIATLISVTTGTIEMFENKAIQFLAMVIVLFLVVAWSRCTIGEAIDRRDYAELQLHEAKVNAQRQEQEKAAKKKQKAEDKLHKSDKTNSIKGSTRE